MKVLNCAQTRELEQKAVETGISYLRLMENAGSAAVRFLLKRTSLSGKKITVLCGKGNNGGDGFVSARRLAELGVQVTAVLAQGQPATPLSQEMFSRLRDTTVRVVDYAADPGTVMQALVCADYIVDGIYGIGFHGEIPGELEELFDAVSGSHAEVLSLDIPSGIQGDTGAVGGKCIRANYTVTFTTLKPAHVLRPGKDFCGEISVLPVGIPASLIGEQKSALKVTEKDDIKPLFSPRKPDSNKGTFGTLLCLCGSKGMAGAAYFSAAAALRCGVGLVDVALPDSIYPIVSSRLAEPIYTVLSSGKEDMQQLESASEKATACLMGCGLGRTPEAAGQVFHLLETLEIPMVVDADGINALAENISILGRKKAPVILTPHPGEMARLLGCSVPEVQARRIEVASETAGKYGVVLVLKGSDTIIAAPDGRLCLNPTGNPGMATGGSGDVLAGMIASFLAQGEEPFFAAAAGAYLHGLVGDRCAETLSQRAMLPSDMIEGIPQLFAQFENQIR